MSIGKILTQSVTYPSCILVMIFSAATFAATKNLPPCEDLPNNGTELASILSREYQSQVSSCNNGKQSALWCSGVLVRPGSPSRHTWALSPAEMTMNSGAAYYLRSKLKTGDFSWGAVISPGSVSANEGKPVCVYPHAVSTEQTRNDAGCGNITPHPIISPVSDLNSCENSAVTDEASYRKSNIPCSFSTQLKTGFHTALSINGNGTEKIPVQIWLSPWSANPVIRGFIYLKNSPIGLTEARREASEYASLTGKRLPVIRFDPTSSSTFTSLAEDIPAPDVSAEATQHLNDDIDARRSITLAYVPPENVSETVYEPFEDRVILTTRQKISIPDSLRPLSNARATYGIATSSTGQRAIFHTSGFVKVSGTAEHFAQKLQKHLYFSSNILLPVVMLDTSGTEQLIGLLDRGDKLFFAEKQQSLVATPAELTAGAIQKRYDSTVHACGDKPAWACSGLIMRATDPAFPFTTPPGAVVGAFSYLRIDDKTDNFWAYRQGIIINPADVKLEKRLKCIYPKDADTHSPHNRNAAAFYCNTSALPGLSANDLSSCKSAGVVSEEGTSRQWSENFQNKHYNEVTQCSFSVHDPVQFYAAILATQQNTGSQTWNELIMSPMPDKNDVPKIEAFWYLVSKNDRNQSGKNAAQNYVAQYKMLRNVTVPVLSFDTETKTLSLVE